MHAAEAWHNGLVEPQEEKQLNFVTDGGRRASRFADAYYEAIAEGA